MKAAFFEEHWVDPTGNPAGGVASGIGMCLSWQNGPLVVDGPKGMTHHHPPNGCFVETVLAAVIGRIEFYQQSRFTCQDNEDALAALRRAAEALDRRTRDRTARQVEGTHSV